MAESSTQVALGARKQIQTAVCVWRFAARPSERQLPAAGRRPFRLFVGFLEPARPARLGWDRGSDVRVTSQIFWASALGGARSTQPGYKVSQLRPPREGSVEQRRAQATQPGLKRAKIGILLNWCFREDEKE